MATGIPVAVGELIDTPTINSWARGFVRKNTAKTVNNTVAATDLLDGEFTIPGGAMGLDRILRISAWGDWKQNSGGTADMPEFQVSFAGTTLLDTGTPGLSLANSTTRFGWRIIIEMLNLGAANIQWVNICGMLASANTNASNGLAFATGRGSIVNLYDLNEFQGGNTGGADTTVDHLMHLNVVNAVSNANYETKLYGALAEII